MVLLVEHIMQFSNFSSINPTNSKFKKVGIHFISMASPIPFSRCRCWGRKFIEKASKFYSVSISGIRIRYMLLDTVSYSCTYNTSSPEYPLANLENAFPPTEFFRPHLLAYWLLMHTTEKLDALLKLSIDDYF